MFNEKEIEILIKMVGEKIEALRDLQAKLVSVNTQRKSQEREEKQSGEEKGP